MARNRERLLQRRHRRRVEVEVEVEVEVAEDGDDWTHLETKMRVLRHAKYSMVLHALLIHGVQMLRRCC